MPLLDIDVIDRKHEGHREDVLLHNGNEAYLSEKDGHIILFWRENTHFLSLSAELDKDTMLWIAYGVQAK